MEIFGFVVGVWAAVIFGLFFIAMVVGCTFDRHYKESPKWWILGLAVVSAVFWQWDSLSFTWSALMATVFSAAIWLPVAYYLLIGLAYSVLEFVLEVRRSARYWRSTWGAYKTAWAERGSVKAAKARDRNILDALTQSKVEEPTEEASSLKALTDEFLNRYSRENNYSKRVIGIEKGETGEIEAKVNRIQLAESIGVWTIFWPFYLFSLIIGDLVTEIFNIAADFLANISGRFVRMSFKDVFKF